MKIRIVSWNVGFKGLDGTFACLGGMSGVLNDMGADIIALQETKHASGSVRAENAVARGWGTFMCCNREGRAGYSGVLMAVRDDLPVVGVQHGLTGALAASGRGSALQESCLAAPLSVCDEDLPPLSSAPLPVGDLALDGEGRAISIDLGFAVIICVYCPAATTEKADRIAEATSFKARFHGAVAARARALRRAGRRVLVVGDLNVSHGPLDHMDPRDWEKRHAAPFASGPYRRWMSGLVGTEAAIRAAAEAQAAPAGSPATSAPWTSSSSPASSPALLSACAVCSQLQSASVSASASATASACTSAVGDPAVAAAASSASSSSLPGAADTFVHAWLPPPEGCTHFNDSFRRFWPHRERAYTCWLVSAGCRTTNYGTRLDYALVSADVPMVAVGEEALLRLQKTARSGSSTSSGGSGATTSGAIIASEESAISSVGISASATRPVEINSTSATGKTEVSAGVHPAFPPKRTEASPAEEALARRYGVIVTHADIAPGFAAQHSDHCPIVLDLVVSEEVLEAARALAPPRPASSHPAAANATQFSHKQASLRQLWSGAAAAPTAAAAAAFSSSSATASAAASRSTVPKASAAPAAASLTAIPRGKSGAAAGESAGDNDGDIITIDDGDEISSSAVQGESGRGASASATAASGGAFSGLATRAISSGSTSSAAQSSNKNSTLSGWSIGGLAASQKGSKPKSLTSGAGAAAASSVRAKPSTAAGASSGSSASTTASLLGKRALGGSLLSAFAVGREASEAGCSAASTANAAAAVADSDASPALAAATGTADGAPPAKRQHVESTAGAESAGATADGTGAVGGGSAAMSSAAPVPTVASSSGAAHAAPSRTAAIAAQPTSSSTSSSSSSSGASAGGAGALRFAMLTPEAPPPKCACGEITVRRRAKATGREFFACKRPEGAPGTPGARCNYFRWASEWQEEQRQAMMVRRQAAATAAAQPPK